MLKDFLDRFNARFGVAAQHPEVAYRPLEPDVCLDTTICFRHSRRVARDNTVKYRWRTLQLLPGTERRSYAGAVVDVLEGVDGQLAVRHGDRIISIQEAPPRPGILRSFNGSSSHGPPPHGDLNGLGRRWAATLAALDAEMGVDDADDSGAVTARKTHLSHAGSPPHFRRQYGTLFRRRSAGGCRFEGLQRGNTRGERAYAPAGPRWTPLLTVGL